jgi:hypothetical protein
MTAQLTLAYEPFVLAPLALETFIVRVPADVRLARRLEEWKRLRREGWDVVVLLAPDSKTVVGLGWRGGG